MRTMVNEAHLVRGQCPMQKFKIDARNWSGQSGRSVPSPSPDGMSHHANLGPGTDERRSFHPRGLTLIDATLDHRSLAPQLSSELLVHVKPGAWRNATQHKKEEGPRDWPSTFYGALYCTSSSFTLKF
jgi:hypothetical protein